MAHDSGSCPLCSGDLVDPEPLEVCRTCHHSLQLGGALPVSNTGEFAAVPATFAARVLAGGPMGPMERAIDASCSWCGKGDQQVKKLLSRGPVHICNECVALCADVLAVELGDDWSR